MKRRVAIIQARMSSTRFPGKALAALDGVSLIAFMCKRVRAARLLDDVVLATSEHPTDDALVEEARRNGMTCFRGSLDDVLVRFQGAAATAAADVIVRLTGDCPLMDADVIDSVIVALEGEGADYASNVDPPTFPDGLDVEAFTREALARTVREATLASEREHVTPFMRNRKDLFKGALVRSMVDMSQVRWTVDYPDDLERVRELVAKSNVSTSSPTRMPDRFDFLRVMAHSTGRLEERRHVRNEGYLLSLERDGKPT
jgi:spore coat polysaccharide biosynthesis protein SpsF